MSFEIFSLYSCRVRFSADDDKCLESCLSRLSATLMVETFYYYFVRILFAGVTLLPGRCLRGVR